jgi:hypothetical protein
MGDKVGEEVGVNSELRAKFLRYKIAKNRHKNFELSGRFCQVTILTFAKILSDIERPFILNLHL